MKARFQGYPEFMRSPVTTSLQVILSLTNVYWAGNLTFLLTMRFVNLKSPMEKAIHVQVSKKRPCHAACCGRLIVTMADENND